MANITRIKNNQITDANVVAYAKLQSGTITGNLFAPTVTINSNVTILGNLTTLGNLDSLNATNTYVNDPLVVFNNGFTGTPSYDIGILVNRNLSSLYVGATNYGSVNTAWIWEESAQRFEAIATTETGATQGTINNAGYVDMQVGNFYASSATLSNGFTSTAGTTNLGTTTIGTLTVTNSTTLQSNVSVSGNAVVNGNIVAAATTTSTSTSTGSIISKGGIGLGGNLIAGGQVQANNGLYSIGSFNGGYGDGIVVDYTSGLGRISVGSGDGISLYNNLDTGTRNALLTISQYGVVAIPSANVSSSYSTGALVVSGGVGIAGAVYGNADSFFAGNVTANGGYLHSNATTFNIVNATPNTINLGGNATAINIGTTTGTVTINNPTLVGTQTTQALYNTVATTLNFAGAATSLNVGANSGTITIGNPTLVGTQTTQAVYNTVATTVNAFGAATALAVGANSGTITIGNPTLVGTQTTQAVYNTVATTVNAFGAATSLNFGASSGTTTVNTATITYPNGTTFNYNGANPTLATTSTGTVTLFNTNAATVNFAGAATAIAIGASNSTTNFGSSKGNVIAGNITATNFYGNITATTASVTNLNATNFATGNAVVTGGDIENTPIGSTTPSTGKFTTLNSTQSATFAGGIQNTPIGNTTPSTGAFTTLTASGVTQVTNNTNNSGTTYSSGALQVTGGAGFGGNVYVAGNLFVQGSTYETSTEIISGVEVVAGVLTANSGTASTSTTTGALLVNGGAGITGAVYAGSIQATPIGSTTASTGAFTTLNSTSTTSLGATTATSINSTPIGATTASTGAFTTLNSTSTTSLGATTATSINSTPIGATTASTGAFTTLNSTSTTSLGATTATSINSTPIGATTASTGAFTTLTASGVTTVTSATASTNYQTGALVVTGGTGIGGTLNVNGASTFTGNMTAGNVIVTGNINAAVGAVASYNGNFYGNAQTGFGALYAGLPTGYSVVPNELTQFTGNGNSYVQINTQNISTGNQATTDWIATANNGTDTTYYVDLGIAGSNYNNTSPYNSLGTSLWPNDAYLYTQGQVSSPGGNLVVGTSMAGTVTRIIAGGINTSSVIGTFTATGLTLNQTTASTGTTSGALIVDGGAGIAGAVYAGSIQATPIGSATASTGAFTTVTTGGLQATAIGNVTPGSGAFTTLTTSGTIISTGNIVASAITATNDNNSGSIVAKGGIAAAGNVNVGATLYVGPSAQTTTTLTNPAIVAVDSGTGYAQVAIMNRTSAASADLIAYPDNYPGSSNDHGWADVGIAGSAFSDPSGNYTITKPNDAYLFGSAVNSGYGGNLVLATDYTGSYNDIVFATNSFYANAEVARFHGNVATSGNFTLKLPTNPTPAANVGALQVWGGTSLSGNVYHGGYTILGGSQVAGQDTVTQGHNDSTLVWARSGTTYDQVVIGGSATTATLVSGAKLQINSTDSMLLPVGVNSQRPSSTTAGMLRYNSTSNTIEWWNGSVWQAPTTNFTVVTDNQFQGDGSTVAFTLSQSTTTAACVVSINGIVQIPTVAYTTSLTTLTFTEAPQVGDTIDVRMFITTQTVGYISSASGNTTIATDKVIGDNIIRFTNNNVDTVDIGSDGTITQNSGNRVINTPTFTIANTSSFTFDTFNTTQYNAVEYYVVAKNPTGTIMSTKILLSGDRSNGVSFTEFGTNQTQTGSYLLSFSAGSGGGGYANLYCTAVTANTVVRVYKTYSTTF